jgi:hypothetical protein
MTVQDDKRELEVCRTFGLDYIPEHDRGGQDASLELEVSGVKYLVSIEAKSTTNDSVSTARDVGLTHTEKWRKMWFIIGFYKPSAKGGIILKTALSLSPDDLSDWINSIEESVKPDIEIAQRAFRSLDLPDLYAICTKKEIYTLEDARRLYKRQWKIDQYVTAMDMPYAGPKKSKKAKELGGFSPTGMLEIVQRRAKYIAERGATLNNPHIGKDYLATFRGTPKETPPSKANALIRQQVSDFIKANPSHPAVNVWKGNYVQANPPVPPAVT